MNKIFRYIYSPVKTLPVPLSTFLSYDDTTFRQAIRPFAGVCRGFSRR